MVDDWSALLAATGKRSRLLCGNRPVQSCGGQLSDWAAVETQILPQLLVGERRQRLLIVDLLPLLPRSQWCRGAVLQRCTPPAMCLDNRRPSSAVLGAVLIAKQQKEEPPLSPSALPDLAPLHSSSRAGLFASLWHNVTAQPGFSAALYSVAPVSLDGCVFIRKKK